VQDKVNIIEGMNARRAESISVGESAQLKSGTTRLRPYHNGVPGVSRWLNGMGIELFSGLRWNEKAEQGTDR
jgi:hypothetical protein